MHTTYTAITNNIKGNKFCLFKYVKKDRFAFSWRSFYYIDKFLNLISRNLDSVPFINLRHLRFYTFNTQYCISSGHLNVWRCSTPGVNQISFSIEQWEKSLTIV